MYLLSSQPNIMGPGTGLVQRTDFTQSQSNRMKGLGCGCAGLAGCPCDNGGLGLFDSGLDPSGWGLPEFAIVALGGYMILSTFFTTKRAARRVSSSMRGAYKGARAGARQNPGRRRARR